MKTFGAAMLLVAAALGHTVAATVADALPEKARGFGRPAADRAWWGEWAKAPEAAVAMRRAESWLKQPMPAFDPERYLDYVRNGDRNRYQALNSRRWDRLKALVLGECLENKRRFVPAIEETVRSLCGDPSWLLPAHDRDASVFHGEDPYVDLGVAMNGCDMAMAVWLLEDRLAPEVVKMMRDNVAKRVTKPVLATIDKTAAKRVHDGHFWARANHNWNAVCTAGTTAAILATEPSRDVRAKTVEWAIKNTELFFSGFGKDGYCSEGIGYWSYGFGHFLVLAELLRDQTDGQVDLLAGGRVSVIAGAVPALEIGDGVFPSFADCGFKPAPERRLSELLRWRLGKQEPARGASTVLAESPTLYQTLMVLQLLCGVVPAERSAAPSLPAHSWFPESGVCVSRAGTAGGIAVAWKGGHNAEHHNHNDVGSTVVVWKGVPLLADIGSMVYRAETFSKERYNLVPHSSWGHSVPVVAGMLQMPGRQAEGKVTDTAFSAERDSVTVDLRGAYPVEGLRKLERQWTHTRAGLGELVIEDRFQFDRASSFATALVATGTWKVLDEDPRSPRFTVQGGGAVLEVRVDFSGPGTWEVQRIDNPGKQGGDRLGLALAAPAADGFVRMRVRPFDGAATTGTALPVKPAVAKLADAKRAPEAAGGSPNNQG